MPRLVWQFEKTRDVELDKVLSGVWWHLGCRRVRPLCNSSEQSKPACSSTKHFFRQSRFRDSPGCGSIRTCDCSSQNIADCSAYSLMYGPRERIPWIYRVHRFFTRKLSREDDKSVDEAELETFDPIKIWDKLTPARQQEVGALIVRSLLEGVAPQTQIWGN